MEQDKINTKEYWEIRAKSFPAYNRSDVHHYAVLEEAKRHGVVFAGKEVLDLGCGSGSYALRIAKEAAHVTALDISAGMLAKLTKSAKEYGITNIKCVEGDWGAYVPNKKFDVIFCSLTPAVASKEDVEKIMKYTQERFVYITSKMSAKMPMFDELFAMHGSEPKVTVFAPTVRDWLSENEVPYDLRPIKGVRESRQTLNELVNNCMEVLDAAGIEPDREKIMRLAEKYKNSEGMYITKTYFDTDMFIITL